MDDGVARTAIKIYFAPSHARWVFSIDPETKTTEKIGPEEQGIFKYCADGVLAPNGKIYFAPRGSRQVLSISLRSF